MKRIDEHSQLFLRGPHIAKQLVGLASLDSNDTAYDIGAGSGIITSVLAGICKHVVAIELESRTVATLRRNMAAFPNVTVWEADFLAIDLPDTAYKVFANIPFHLSSQIVRKLTEAANPPSHAYMIVQKQFADKLLPDHTGFSSQLGMQIGSEFAVTVKRSLRRTDFWPHPHVDTVLIELAPRYQPLIRSEKRSDYKHFILQCFTDQEYFRRILDRALFPQASVRPSQLTLVQWTTLFNMTEDIRGE